MCWRNVYPDIIFQKQQIFLAGCLVNALTSAKRFMEKNKVAGVILAITAVVLLVLSAMCFAAVLK